ncbi:DUF3127 domain-containing protein [Cardinium endosymbiont of Culicoides punctatus]|uniref:DUF3127 domain-containing protein n=1 Tax=Cardinium endosymbiont of Culicoides punctatus TaxID=2304601 RepID=UPI001058D828|nr:DUF3127 domain-containing protein [Cardinium endosymbiont of Culicoides punctatus]TDG93068.1 hypothetical protein CCPUN_09500 [Cardinium endosymbiont of Culicoides punctatus]
MNITGKIFEINAPQQVSDSFRKRLFVIEHTENPQYPEYVSFELIQDKCDLLDEFSEGDEVTVHFNLRGRKWTNPEGVVKYFNSLQAWRLERGNKVSDSSASSASNMEEKDDLPF